MVHNQQDLITLINASRAAALMVLRGNSVAVNGGALSREGLLSFKTALLKYWPDETQHDLNRYIGLSLDGQFFLLFAKFLPDGNHLLGLAFPLQTPLIRIRQDMTDIQRAIVESDLDSPDANQLLEQSLHDEPKAALESEPDAEIKPLISGWHPEQDQEMNHAEDRSVSQEKTVQPKQPDRKAPASPKRYLTYGAPMDRVPQAPSPKVTPEQKDIPWHLIGESFQDSEIGLEPVPDVEEAALEQGQETWQSLSELPHPSDDLVNILQADFEGADDFKGAGLWRVQHPESHESRTEAYSLSDDDTSPIFVQTEKTDMEEVSETTFYLVPRLATHYILGELSHRMRNWLPAVCKRYGWQLTFLSVRPDYIKWTLSDFPESLLQKMLQAVRREMSERIFHVYPDLQTGNQTGDYWAPGYLVDTQNREFSTQALIAHISQNRLGSV